MAYISFVFPFQTPEFTAPRAKPRAKPTQDKYWPHTQSNQIGAASTAKAEPQAGALQPMQATNNNKTSFVHERKVIKTTSSHRHADIAELKCAPTPHVKATAAVQPADRRDQRLQLFGRFPAFDSARREKRIRKRQSHAQQHPSPDGRVWGERPSHAAANKMRLVTFAGRTEFRGSQTVQ